MKIINHSFGVDLNSAELSAQSLGGKVEGNFIVVPESIHTGVRYFLNCGPGINALYIDAEYNDDILFKQFTTDDNYVGLYYDLTKGEADFGLMDVSYPVGEWHFDLVILDCSIRTEYFIRKGSKTLALYIFIEKDLISEYFIKKKNPKFNLKRILNSSRNSSGRFEKMSYDSYTKLKSLQSKNPHDS